jgi:hypothetical protein
LFRGTNNRKVMKGDRKTLFTACGTCWVSTIKDTPIGNKREKIK